MSCNSLIIVHMAINFGCQTKKGKQNIYLKTNTIDYLNICVCEIKFLDFIKNEEKLAENNGPRILNNNSKILS